MLRFRKFVSRGRALGRELVRGAALGVHLGGDLIINMAPVLAVAGRLRLVSEDLVALLLLAQISSLPRTQQLLLEGIDAEAPPAFIRVRLVVGGDALEPLLTGTMAPRSTISAKVWRRSSPSHILINSYSAKRILRRRGSIMRWQRHARSSPTPARLPRPIPVATVLSLSVFRKPTPWRHMRGESSVNPTSASLSSCAAEAHRVA